MERIITILVLSLALGQGNLVAQSTPKHNAGHATGIQMTGQVQLGLPQNEFAEVFNGYPTGAGVSLMLPFGKVGLFQLGGEYAWNSMGEEKSLVDLYNDAQDLVSGDLTVSSDVRSYHGLLRFSPFSGGIRPYFDVYAGYRSYSTDSEIMVEDNDGTVHTTSHSVSRDGTMSYGYGGGLMLALGKHVFIDGKVQVLRGGTVTYVDQGTLVIDTQGEIDYSLRTTETDLIIPQVGLSIVF